ncbi:helix-turn-helix transcriptional regulator [Bacillus sp. AGMB 02131]|uniref:Helix-turn-helix transcriptional regulator n=1 Tax=Peribacillus faecalis TaxID=2772559 RepID=A0A927HAE5_9BACI|nr:AraC family transcriptional regulator [Peribacillus faecalis]MBD3107467.1 helix-turn-helix transcriptional regulator [Peribacillus faecalis]
MQFTVQQIIDYYANATIAFTDLFKTKLEYGKVDEGRYTAPNTYGLVIPFRGKANFTFKGSTYKMHPRMIVHAGSAMDIVIETTSREPWEYAVVHYAIPESEKQQFPHANEHFAIPITDNMKIIELVLQLEKHFKTPGNTSKLQAKVVFMQLIEEIVSSAKKQMHDNRADRITDAVNYINAHYTEITSISELADQFGIERRRFAYLFAQSTGMSPVQYITDIRLKTACQLLKTTNDPISHIAEHIGYPDNFYFSRLFKKHIGMNPSSYRQHAANKIVAK